MQVLKVQASAAVRRLELEGIAELPSLAPLLGNSVGIALGPCRLWNHRGIWIFHIYCIRKWLEDLDDRSIGLELEPGSGFLRLLV